MRRKPVSLVPEDRTGSTLEEYLASRFTYLRIEEWLMRIAEGRVSVNGEAASGGRRLSAGDSVAYDPPDAEEPEVDSSFRIAMEDADFLIVDKSGSLPCHPSGRYFEHSLWFLLRERYGPTHIATRLDRETSGLVLVCKSADAARYVQGLQSAGGLRKRYVAMVHGRFPGRVEARGRLVSDPDSAIRKKRRYLDGAPPRGAPSSEGCETMLECLASAELDSGWISLVRAQPSTGRTHQIRATLFSLGFPLVGDKLYGLDEGCFLRFAEDRLADMDKARLMLPQQALHCAALEFPSPGGLGILAQSSPRWGYPYGELLAALPDVGVLEAE
jgi:23S rRNA-/tRNA-specific pseudouridylate synthase